MMRDDVFREKIAWAEIDALAEAWWEEQERDREARALKGLLALLDEHFPRDPQVRLQLFGLLLAWGEEARHLPPGDVARALAATLASPRGGQVVAPAEAAESYARRGLRVFPCLPGEKRPHPGLAPAADGQPGGFHQATNDPGVITEWWRQEPTANIGLPTGQDWPDDPDLSLMVLDLDVKHRPDLRAKVDALLDDLALRLETWVARTPSGGGHVYTLTRRGAGITNLVDEAGPLGELRGHGGYVLVPPSQAGGGCYTWLSPLAEDGLPQGRPLVVDDALEWALSLLREFGIQARVRGETRRAAYHTLAERPAQPGERNVALFSYASALRRAGLGYEDILTHLREMNSDPGKVAVPLPERELEHIAASACRYPPGDGHNGTHADAPPAEALERGLDEAFTDRNLARTFAELARDQALFVPQWGWLLWDGRRWARDEGGHRVMALAMDILPRHFAERAIAAQGEARAQLLEMAKKAMSRQRLSAALELAKGLLLADPSEFDRDPFALNCLNGTVDLRTGELRPHDPQDRITRLAPVEYTPDAQAPAWERFLSDIFLGDQELVAYIQRALGYSITGDTREDCVFIAWGSGRNGKTVLLETVAAVVGDYARSVSPDLILARGEKDDTHPHVLAELAGVRLATISETEEERRLNASRLKALSGRDTMTARHLYRPYFNFRPQGKLWLRTNYKPRVTDHSVAMWERLRLIPFRAYFPPERRDKELPEKLLAEAPGILAWLVKGAQAWLKTGLQEPAAVAEATAAYRSEQDIVGQWLEERTEADSQSITPFKALYDDYRSWCEEAGDLPLGPRRFAAALEERGFAKATLPDGKTKARRGLRLRGDASPNPPAVPPNPPIFQENSPPPTGGQEFFQNIGGNGGNGGRADTNKPSVEAIRQAFEEAGAADLLGQEEEAPSPLGPPWVRKVFEETGVPLVPAPRGEEAQRAPPGHEASGGPPHPPRPCPSCRDPDGWKGKGYRICQAQGVRVLLRTITNPDHQLLHHPEEAVAVAQRLWQEADPDVLVLAIERRGACWAWRRELEPVMAVRQYLGFEPQVVFPLRAFTWVVAQSGLAGGRL
jgi:putative DNA primase/helicase